MTASNRSRRIAAVALCALATATATAAADLATNTAAPRDVYPHHTPRVVQPFITTVHQWLGREHGLASTVGRARVYSVERWPFRALAGNQAIYARAAVDLETCRVSYGYAGAHDVTLIRRRAAGQVIKWTPNAATTAIHELLHCHNPKAPEGVVDAVAADLTAPFLRYYIGQAGARVRDPAKIIEYPQAFTVFRKTARAAGVGYRHPDAAALRRHMLRSWGRGA